MSTHQGGSVQFESSVSLSSIESLIGRLKNTFTGEWYDIHVRYAGDDRTHYLAYRYDLTTEDPNLHKKFHNDILDVMFDHFGVGKRKRPKGVINWSMSRLRFSGV